MLDGVREHQVREFVLLDLIDMTGPPNSVPYLFISVRRNLGNNREKISWRFTFASQRQECIACHVGVYNTNLQSSAPDCALRVSAERVSKCLPASLWVPNNGHAVHGIFINLC
jgi:hypothetical protein